MAGSKVQWDRFDQKSHWFLIQNSDGLYRFEAFNREAFNRWISALVRETEIAKQEDPLVLNRDPDFITPREFFETAESGDLLLFQSKTIGANFQRIITRSNYDHVALVIKFANNRLVIFEALRENGVSICDWDRFMTKKWFQLYNRIAYRKLQCKKTPRFTDILEDFVRQTLGKPFKINPMKLLRNTNDQDHAGKIKESKSYFCSELVATAYKRLNLLDPEKAASKYWPGEFSQEDRSNEIRLLNGARLGDE